MRLLEDRDFLPQSGSNETLVNRCFLRTSNKNHRGYRNLRSRLLVCEGFECDRLNSHNGNKYSLCM